ncbi:hypothetical protein GCM10011344_26770 [Dokdonia pacifica]|uniref:Type IV secretion-system coupling protein DNA-binding domain-containing protein n=1 Tax=Dokdonia pacifica TaxID=1627892 RepID=A0A239E1J7_9FLAO|nr:type IV secretion system DNA-binding domain-containing protein [Dokdonia pacifica]GGG24741.1 hypothetical protein GCM10011344_26770 [Dokdonia pacifica]SNS37754.1 Type IV secretion-system coupling protein DNA-binding domain-containing protein [Dokdonia pacifica]
MNLNASEHATIHFYEWEKRIRGHYHFDVPVELEPYYVPFEHRDTNNHHVDDGKAITLFDRIGSLIRPQKQEEPKESTSDYIVHQYTPTTELVGVLLRFPIGAEIYPQLFREFLQLITQTKSPVSFEILAKKGTMAIQIVSSQQDYARVQSQLRAYFPNVSIETIENVFDYGIDLESETVTIVDFGLSQETMRPIAMTDSFRIDPLTSIIATMDNLGDDDVAIFQILFQGVENPWAYDMQNAVSDGTGGSFFSNSPEMPKLAYEKTSDSLFSVVVRVVVESNDTERSEYVTSEFIQSITTVSDSGYNKLKPLDNKDYDYKQHLRNIFLRCSNRLGFLLNSKELVQFVHYPNRTVNSAKLGIEGSKTKSLPKELIQQPYYIGINEHNRELNNVSLNDDMRLRHTHIIGATGVGKSTLIANMVLRDAEHGNGCAIFDPHGDICEDILARIPEHRINDVILVDPSDIEHPIGFNLLGAHTEAEKIVLSSDLASSFKRYATAWGDNMTSVLSNAINTFLENPNGGTIIELKRFILEEKFRNEFLENVEDPSLHYYWKNEYPMVKKGIAPLLTRIDTFLRPKTVRYMLAQKEGIDFKACIEQKKIILIKLSQGLIGEENSYLLGSLFLAKLNQVAIGRQSLAKSQRHPFYVYLDEFQNFITPSITSILSGARKYGLGLILAHQELAQIDDTKTLNSVMSNPYTRICFRLGDSDAKRLESGFSFFEQNDLQSLGIGQAIMRVGSSNNDFNIQTDNLPEINTEHENTIRASVVVQTRAKYGKPRSAIEHILVNLLPNLSKSKKAKELPKKQEIIPDYKEEELVIQKREVTTVTPTATSLEEQKESYLKGLEKQKEIKRHSYLQEHIAQLARQRGFKASIEKQTSRGGRIDVVLENNQTHIAIEVAITNTLDYEVKNIQKCLADNYIHIWVISDSDVHLRNIEKKSSEVVDANTLESILFIKSDEVVHYLDTMIKASAPKQKKIQGYRVTTSFQDETAFSANTKQNEITDIILKALQKSKKK